MEYAIMNTDYAPAKIVIGSYEFTSEEYRIDSISMTSGCYDGNVLGIGYAYTNTCTITMEDIGYIPSGTKIQIFFEIDNAYELFGVFYATSSPQVIGDVIEISGQGALGKEGNTPFYYPGMFDIMQGNTIGQMLGGITEVSEMSSLTFDTEDDISGFLNKKIIVPVKFEYFTGGSSEFALSYVNQGRGITKKDFLQGIAMIFGGNVVERRGTLYIEPKNPPSGRTPYIFGKDTYSSSFRISRETYAFQDIILNCLSTRELNFFTGSPDNITSRHQQFAGTERVKRGLIVSQSPNAANIRYNQEIECDWIGYFVENNGGSYIQGDLVYRTGSYEFTGYNENIYPGNIIYIENEVGENIPFYIGECTISWDGGFTTSVSCNCNVDTSGATVTSNVSSSASSSANFVSAMNSQNSILFADIAFSNVKDSTISGSKFIDGSISGSKIADSAITDSKISDSSITGSKFVDGTIEGAKIKESTITNSLIADSTLTGAKIKDAEIAFEKVDKSFISDLTADKAYVDDFTARIGQFDFLETNELSAKVAEINSLTATDAIIKNIFSDSIISDKAVLDVLQANVINAEYIKGAVADVGYITAEEADLSYADITFGNIDTAHIDKTKIGLLFAEVGLIDRATIVDGHVTGYLSSVKINADVIDAGTLSTDRLLVTGDDGIVYKINVNSSGLSMSELQDEKYKKYLNGTDIVAGSITANELDVANVFADSAVIDKISVGVADVIELDAGRITSGFIASERIKAESITADKLKVDDLSSIKATIGGFSIGDGKLYSEYQYESSKYTFTINSGKDSLPGIVMRYDSGNSIARYGPQFITIDTKGDQYSYYNAMGVSGKRFYMMATDINGNPSSDIRPFNGNNIALEINLGELENSSEFTSSSTPSITANIPFKINDSLILGEKGNDSNYAKLTYDGSRITSTRGFKAENLNGYIAIKADSGVGRLSIKGLDGNVWGIDGAGGSLRFINETEGATPMYISKDGGAHIKTIYEGNALLKNKYAVVKTGTVEANGLGYPGWVSKTVSFGVTYSSMPLVSLVPYGGQATENSQISSYAGNSTDGYTGMVVQLYAPQSGYVYKTRWFTIGNIK